MSRYIMHNGNGFYFQDRSFRPKDISGHIPKEASFFINFGQILSGLYTAKIFESFEELEPYTSEQDRRAFHVRNEAPDNWYIEEL